MSISSRARAKIKPPPVAEDARALPLMKEVERIRHELSDPRARIRYCLEPLIGFSGDNGYLPRRAFIAAGRLLGVARRDIKRLVRRLEEGQSISSIFVGELPGIPLTEFGWVYRGRLREYPFIVKIGISKDPHRRMEDLWYETKCRHVLEHIRAGLVFDETLEFLKRRAFSINSNEWFFDPDRPMGRMPKFLAGTWSDDQWLRARAVTEAQTAADIDFSASAVVNLILEDITFAPQRERLSS